MLIYIYDEDGELVLLYVSPLFFILKRDRDQVRITLELHIGRFATLIRKAHEDQNGLTLILVLK